MLFPKAIVTAHKHACAVQVTRYPCPGCVLLGHLCCAVSRSQQFLCCAVCTGINSFFAGLAGSLPNTTFAQNNGVLSLTRCASRSAGYSCGIWLVLFGILAKVPCTNFAPGTWLVWSQAHSDHGGHTCLFVCTCSGVHAGTCFLRSGMAETVACDRCKSVARNILLSSRQSYPASLYRGLTAKCAS